MLMKQGNPDQIRYVSERIPQHNQYNNSEWNKLQLNQSCYNQPHKAAICLDDQIDINKKIYIRPKQNNFLEIKKAQQPQQCLAPFVNPIPAQFQQNWQKNQPQQRIAGNQNKEIEVEKQFQQNTFKDVSYNQPRSGLLNFERERKSESQISSQQNQDDEYNLLKTSASRLNQTMMQTMYQKCHHCQNSILGESIQLDCWHLFHQQCLTDLIHGQLNSGLPCIKCHCQKKILGPLIRKKFPALLDLMMKNQLSALRNNNVKIVDQCNKCNFWWIISHLKPRQQKCIDCSFPNLQNFQNQFPSNMLSSKVNPRFQNFQSANSYQNEEMQKNQQQLQIPKPILQFSQPQASVNFSSKQFNPKQEIQQMVPFMQKEKNQYCGLECLKCFNQKGLIDMLKNQLNAGKVALICNCQKKIKQSAIRIWFKDLFEQLMVNQLKELCQNNKQVIFVRCNSCSFFWIPINPKIRFLNCPYCSKE